MVSPACPDLWRAPGRGFLSQSSRRIGIGQRFEPRGCNDGVGFFSSGFAGLLSGSGVFLPVGNQARDGHDKDDLHAFIEDFVENPIVGVTSEEDNATQIAAPFQVGQSISDGQCVVSGGPDGVVAAAAVEMNTPKMLLAFEDEYGRCRGVAMDRAVSTVRLPPHHHIECSCILVVAENRVVVTDLVGKIRVADDFPPFVASGVKEALPHDRFWKRGVLRFELYMFLKIRQRP